MNGLMTVIIAHDTTCEPGEEWMFHDFPKPPKGCCSKDGVSMPEKDKERLDRDMEELRKHSAKEDETNDVERAKCGCALVIVAAFIFLLGLPIGISYLIERLMS